MAEIKTMTVKFDFEFEFDASDYDPDFVDVEGLAKDSAWRDLKDQIKNGCITDQDFYIVKGENT